MIFESILEHKLNIMLFGYVMHGNLSSTAVDIVRGVTRLMGDRGLACLSEMTLANSRRADVAALSPAGEVEIVEVKSCLADYRSDEKWPEYAPYCDRFYFAVDADFPNEIIPATCGLIIADRFGGAIIRAPETRKLSAARRKAMTLRFARIAAQRLTVATPGLLDGEAGLGADLGR